jgi:LPXTG-motif cell wall-anchored protein
MYNELPHTGAGVLILTAVALIISGAGAVLRWFGRS